MVHSVKVRIIDMNMVGTDPNDVRSYRKSAADLVDRAQIENLTIFLVKLQHLLGVNST